jgi:hypothetical protein
MAVFISVTTDPFEEALDEARRTATQPQVNVRRPLRGLQIKEDRYAVLKVLKANGQELRVNDSSSDVLFDADNREATLGLSSNGWSNFIVQNITEQRAEKQQIIETFGEDYIFFFGERPRFIDVAGILINTADFDWKNEFWHNYENYLRGTKLVENNARLYLYFDDVVVEGYLLQATTSQQATMPYHLPFNFRMVRVQLRDPFRPGQRLLPTGAG